MNIKYLKRLRKIKKWLKWTYPRIKSAYEDMRRNAFYLTNYLIYLDFRHHCGLMFWIINFILLIFIYFVL